VLTLFEAINGYPGIKHYPMDTSVGFGLKGRKIDYFETTCAPGGCGDSDCCKYHPLPSEYVVPGREVNYYPTPQLLAQIASLEEALLAGEVDLAIFRAALKDEPVKVGKEKIRVFFVGMLAFNLVVRRYVTPLFAALQTDMSCSECAVGIDVASLQWDTLMTRLDSYNGRSRIAGDYSNYDNSIPECLISAAYSVVHEVARSADWDGRALEIIDALRVNMMNPIYIVLGTVYRASGTNPSGVAITTYVNSLVNCLVHRYAFFEKNPGTTEQFSKHVALATYGDDVLGAVRVGSQVSPIDNHDVCRVAGVFGMVYGAIDKNSDLPRLYAREQVSFLKCENVFAPDLRRQIGVLDKASIAKSLYFERNKGLEARRSTCESALRLYSRHVFARRAQLGSYERLRAELAETLYPDVDLSVAERALPSYDTLLEEAKEVVRHTPCLEGLLGEF